MDGDDSGPARRAAWRALNGLDAHSGPTGNLMTIRQLRAQLLLALASLIDDPTYDEVLRRARPVLDQLAERHGEPGLVLPIAP